MHFFRSSRQGFTLAETLVAVAIFTIVFTIGVGGFVSAMRTQRQLQALISANSNASLAIEQMAREIRTGVNFQATNEACVGTNCRLKFTNVHHDDIQYWRDDTDSLMRSSLVAPGGEPITAQNVAVRYLEFHVIGECDDPEGTPKDHAPRITIALGISPRSEKGVSEDITEIQTTVTSRQGFTCSIPLPPG